MSYGIDTVKEYAECWVDEGTRDSFVAIMGALDQLLSESSMSEGVGWSLFEKVFTVSDVMDFIPNAYDSVLNYVYGQLHDSIDEYIGDHTYTISFFTQDGEWDTDEEYENHDDFVQAIEDNTGDYGGYVVVGVFDPENDTEVSLREFEEEEEE